MRRPDIESTEAFFLYPPRTGLGRALVRGSSAFGESGGSDGAEFPSRRSPSPPGTAPALRLDCGGGGDGGREGGKGGRRLEIACAD